MQGLRKKTVKEKIETGNGDFSLIISIISRGYSDYVVDAARDAGASGATIIYGRGSMKTKESILGINIEPEKEIVMIVVTKDQRRKVMTEIAKRTSLSESGNGICFSVPVDTVAGSTMLSKQIKELNSKSSSEKVDKTNEQKKD